MKNSIKELTEGMQRLCAIANKIVSHEGDVSRIERDLLLEDLRRLYDVALRMGEENGGKQKEASEEKQEEMATIEPDEEMLSSTVMATMAAMAPAVESPSNAEPIAEPKAKEEAVPIETLEEKESESEQTEPAEASIPESQPQMEEIENNGNSLLFDEVIIEPEEETTKAPEPESVPEPEPTPAPVPEHHASAGTQASLLDYLHAPQAPSDTLGDQLKPAVPTLGERLGNKVSDLRTVININDKFSFMSELFHNNMKAYNDFILRLNAIDTRDEALLCVNEMAAQYKWDENSLAVQSFYKVFDKKF